MSDWAEIAKHTGSLAHDLRIAATEVSDPTRAERLRTLAEWLDGQPAQPPEIRSTYVRDRIMGLWDRRP